MGVSSSAACCKGQASDVKGVDEEEAGEVAGSCCINGLSVGVGAEDLKDPGETNGHKRDEGTETKEIFGSLGSLATHFAQMGSKNNDAAHSMGEAELAGLNFTVNVMWPHLRKAIERRGKQDMLERATMEIEKHGEFHLHELEIEFDPGERPPTFNGVRVYRKHKTAVQPFEGLQIDADITWKTEGFKCMPKIKGTLKGIEVNLQDLSVSALELDTTASTVLAPLLAEEPCFGAAQVYFLDMPHLKMWIRGMENHSWIKKYFMDMMRKMTTTLVTDSYVLPHRMVVKARHIALETMIAVKSPLPIGLLEIEVCEAKNLLALDLRPFGGSSSDPYVKVGIGEGEFKTSTRNKTVNPKWDDGPDYLPVYSLAQGVKVSVYDADVMSSDFIGSMEICTVYSLWKDMQEDAESDGGKWFPLAGRDKDGKTVSAGEIKLKVRFVMQQDVFLKQDRAASSESGDPLSPTANAGYTQDGWDRAMAASASSKAPRLLTVKLLGLEGVAAKRMAGAYCIVHYEPAAVDPNAADDSGGGWFSRMFQRNASARALGRPTRTVTSSWSKALGNTLEQGMPDERRTGKAKLWSSLLTQKKSLSLPPEVVRAIEHLRYREKWDDDKIAGMFGISKELVHSAAELRASFEVVWHEACHFVQPPEREPFAGKIIIEVYIPRKMAKSKLHIDRTQGKVTDESVALANAVASNGYVGMVRLSLDSKPIEPDNKWSRRVRARLRRDEAMPDTGEDAECSLQGESQCDASVGKVVPGMLIEFMVEVRPLHPDSPEAFVEDDQAVMGAGRSNRSVGHGIEVMQYSGQGAP